MSATDHVELYVLYGFRAPTTFDLDVVDFEWCELACDGATYALTRAALPQGAWLSQGYSAELIDVRYVSFNDPRYLGARRTHQVTMRSSW
jgi:hypothetical protein